MSTIHAHAHALARAHALTLALALAHCTADPGPATAETDDALSAETAAPDLTPPAPPAIISLHPALADPDGGGTRIVITVDRSDGVTGATLGVTALGGFAIDDATHVSGVPPAHAAGVVDVVLQSAAGESTGHAAFEYWTPAQIVGIDTYLDAAKGITGDDGAVGGWLDQGPHARSFTQADPALRPMLVPATFGDLAALRFTPGRFLALAAPAELPTGSSIFAVAAWTATTALTPPPGNLANVPLTIVGDGTNAYGSFGVAGGAVAANHYVGGPVYTLRGVALNDGVARLVGASWDALTVTRIFVGNAQVGVDDNSAPLAGTNTYDRIGAGYGPAATSDGYDGDLGAVIIVAGAIGIDDREKLDRWAEQRFGTPTSAPLDPWTREFLAEMPLEPDLWHPRDGAQLVQLGSGRVLMLGGWNPRDLWGPGGADNLGARVTNEVWASDDRGVTWRLLLAHDPDAPRFPPGHTFGVTTWRGHAVTLGTDCLGPPYLGDVWHESDDGLTWTRVATDAPTLGRCLFMVGTLGDSIYMMGGQTNLYDPATGIADVWRSDDGGVSWEQLDDPPWAPRAMNYRPAELDGRLFIAGGGLYADAGIEPVAFNGVFAFDGSDWTTVLPDGHDQWQATYYNAMAALGGRLWLFDGFTGYDELSRTLVSDDEGVTWQALPGGSGGDASHADAVVALEDRVVRISGNLSERRVYAFRHR